MLTRLRVGTYNLLCPFYGLKWGEREACVDWKSNEEHGGSNWPQRWPALLRNLGVAPLDVLALQEVFATPHIPCWDLQRKLLAALQEMLATGGVADAADIEQVKKAWTDAYLTTPHGQPVAIASR